MLLSGKSILRYAVTNPTFRFETCLLAEGGTPYNAPGFRIQSQCKKFMGATTKHFKFI
jgi:hypothetical protein